MEYFTNSMGGGQGYEVNIEAVLTKNCIYGRWFVKIQIKCH